MALFNRKNQQAEQERQAQNVKKVTDQCSEQVSKFSGITIDGEKYLATNLQLDVSRLIGASMLLDDESILWWTVKVCALICDSGDSLPVRDVAKNLMWCKSTGMGIVEKYPKQTEILKILNRVDQAWFSAMEKGEHFKSATQLIADEKEVLMKEMR